MLVHKNLSALPRFRNAVITIGTFDGVHAGHRKIIEQLKREAEQIDGETVIITFHPHPRKIVREGQPPVAVLTTLPEKILLLQSLGVNHLVVIPFNEAFANQTAEEYIQHFLFEKFHPHTVIIGYDHKFGKGRSGDYQLLEKYGSKLHFTVKEIPEQVLNEVTISSTKIRQALINNDVVAANSFLGYDYFFEGLVVKGNQLGRTIGYPTANIEIEDVEKLIPGNGVYAVEVSAISFQRSAFSNQVIQVEEAVVPQSTHPKPQASSLTPQTFQGMMNIGLRPTVDGKKRTIEVNIFNFNEDIYSKTLRVSIKNFIRTESKFNGLDALKEQLAKDKETAFQMLNAGL